MRPISSICVFCGSSPGDRPAYRKAAADLGRAIAERGLETIYGGGHIGLMGVVADAALAAGGRVIGIIPRHLSRVEVGHQGLTELIEVDTMFARKALMIERADAFVILPGGIGTLDELMEVLTLRQLRQHAKPTVIVDVEGYWADLTALFDHIVDHGFARRDILGFFTTVAAVDDIFAALGVER